METEKTKEQARKILDLKKENRMLKRELKKLKKDLYDVNEKRPTNKSVLRVKDIVYKFSVSKSTVWLYATKKYITPIKNSSRVTTFDTEEVEAFFQERNNRAMDITPYSKISNKAERKAKEKLERGTKMSITKKLNSIKHSPSSPLNKQSK